MLKDNCHQDFSHHVGVLAREIWSLNQSKERVVIAIAGAPASGKSTLAAELVDYVNNSPENNGKAAILPMDGFHLDNRILHERNLLHRKGAPQTFDVDGFCHVVERLRMANEDIVHPIFDRSTDMAVAGAGIINRDISVVVIEGNYLLLDEEKWKSLYRYYDYRVFIKVSTDILEKRLIQRWEKHGFSSANAKKKASDNDLLNMELIMQKSLPADRYIDGF